jgi:hypothetical protein
MTTDTEEDIPSIYKYGPWKEINVIYDKNDTKIIEVELIKNINNNEISKTLNKHKWVVKFRPHSVPELYQYLFLIDHNVKNIIKPPVPENNYYNFGVTEYGLWYAMKKYTPVTKNLFFVDKWRQLAIAGIKFMQNIHQLHHVYLDFKFANTYYEEDLEQFIFADYDSLFHINNKLLSEYTNDFKYYYLIQGGELDKPCRSFKYDLLAFGYFLAKLTCLEKEYDEIYQWQFEKLATTYRKMSGPFTNIDQMCIKNIDQHIIELRNNVHKNFNTFIKNYFEEVNRMNWFLETCPSKIYYNQLCDIFSFNHHDFD